MPCLQGGGLLAVGCQPPPPHTCLLAQRPELLRIPFCQHLGYAPHPGLRLVAHSGRQGRTPAGQRVTAALAWDQDQWPDAPWAGACCSHDDQPARQQRAWEGPHLTRMKCVSWSPPAAHASSPTRWYCAMRSSAAATFGFRVLQQYRGQPPHSFAGLVRKVSNSSVHETGSASQALHHAAGSLRIAALLT